MNRVAIVTGAGSGIDRATASLVAREGAKVVPQMKNKGRVKLGADGRRIPLTGQ